MEQNTFSKVYAFFILAIIVVIAVLGLLYGKEMLVWIGFSEAPSSPASSETTSTTPPTTDTVVHQTHEITGVVQAIDGSSITVTTSVDIPASIKWSSTTKFYKGIPNIPSAHTQGNGIATTSEPFTRTAGSIAEIKVGDMIIATLDQTAKNAASFVATEILLLQKPDLRNL